MEPEGPAALGNVDNTVDELGDLVDQGGELVPADAGQQVPGTQRGLEAPAHAAQDLVADGMSERVVDVFEPVEVEEQKRNFVLSPTSTGERLG